MLKKLAIVCAVGVGVAGIAAVIEAPVTVMPACESEDYVPESGACYWNAGVQGNGLGLSFIAYDDGTVEFTE